MVFQDGDAYKTERVGTVVDNLIADGKMPVTHPRPPEPRHQRRRLQEPQRRIRHAVRPLRHASWPTKFSHASPKTTRLAGRPSLIAPSGEPRSGGICAFTAAWHRPDLFGKVLSQIGSFTNIRGGNAYPELVKSTDAKPIKIMLTDGTNDLINRYGNWWQANEAMFAALKAKGYTVEFLRDRGFHAYWTCGRQLPEALRWLWSDQVAPK